jgi:hypothetical protein
MDIEISIGIARIYVWSIFTSLGKIKGTNEG